MEQESGKNSNIVSVKQEVLDSIKFEFDSTSQDSNVSSKSGSGSYQRWAPNLDGIRKSAFMPYKPQCTALTNFQRGNTQARVPDVLLPETTFHARAGCGEVSREDALAEQDVDVLDEHKLSALHWAAYYGQIYACQNLVWAGADVNVKGPENETALHLAAAGGHHEVVKFLLSENAEVNEQDVAGNTALMYACMADAAYATHELLNKAADMSITNHLDLDAYTICLNYNAQIAQTVMENFLLQKLG